MEFDNKTPYPAHFYRTAISDDTFAASVLVRVTFDVGACGIVPGDEQPWITSRAPFPSPQGEMESDDVYYRGGCDVFLFGSARPADGKAARELEVRVTVGDLSRSVRVFGDRVWAGEVGSLKPSQPAPFESIPLTLPFAFGGKPIWDELEVPHPDNPAGRGFYLEEEEARGQPLPNLEEPDQLVTKWDDRPEPVGLGVCPMRFGPRVRRGAIFDDEGALLKIDPTLFNAAFPRMIAARIEPGMRVVVTGVRAGEPLELTVPELSFVARLRFGDDVHDEPLEIDQLGIEVDEARMFVSYRYAFRYTMTPGRPRSCTVTQRFSPGA
jgi:hypothetical protein